MGGGVHARPVGHGVRRVRNGEHAADGCLRLLAVEVQQAAAIRSPSGFGLVVDILRQVLDFADPISRESEPRDRRLVAAAHVRGERDAVAIRRERGVLRFSIFALAGIQQRDRSTTGGDKIGPRWCAPARGARRR